MEKNSWKKTHGKKTHNHTPTNTVLRLKNFCRLPKVHCRALHSPSRPLVEKLSVSSPRGVATDTFSSPAEFGEFSDISLFDTLQPKKTYDRTKSPKDTDRLGLLQKANLRDFQLDLPEAMRLTSRDASGGSLFSRAVDTELPGSSDSWSSPHDNLISTPSQVKIDHSLWSLIDAAIQSGQISRAESFLANLGHAKIWRPDRMRLCLRELAQVYVRDNSVQDSLRWLGSMEKNFGVSSDAQMYAHVVHKLCCDGRIGEVDNVLFKRLPVKLHPTLVVEEIQIIGLEHLPAVLAMLVAREFDFRQFGDAYVELFEELLEHKQAVVEKPVVQSKEQLRDELKQNLRGAEKINTHTKDGQEVIGIEIVKNMLLHVDGDRRVLDFVHALPYVDEIPAELLDPSRKLSLFEIKNALSGEHRADFEAKLEELNQVRQFDVELRGIEAAGELWAAKAEQSQQFSGMAPFQAQMYEWQTLMVPLIEKAIAQAASKAKDADVYPYMTLLEPKQMAIVTIIEMMRHQTTVGRSVDAGVKTSTLVTSLGRALETEYRCHKWSAALGRKKTFLNKLTGLKRRLKVQEMISAEELKETVPSWALESRAKLGAMLVDVLIGVARMPVTAKDPVSGAMVTAEVPVFGHSYQLIKRHRHGMIRMHENLAKRITGSEITSEAAESMATPQFLPMLAKPKPWTSWNQGGHYVSQVSIMRARESSEQTAYLDTASDRGDLARVFAGLNKLGATGWTVNSRVFDVMSSVWNSGEPFLDIPSASASEQSVPDCPDNNDPAVRSEWRKLCTILLNKRKSDHSVRCDANYKLEIARAHLGEKLHFPHNMDFRGRAYPLSPHFNHLGSDLSRGLLHFWEGKELGEEGLKWLKVHMANLHGAGKASFEQRVLFTENHMEDIRKCAADPLNPQNDFWKKADYPWQFLAACYEMVAAHELPDPTKFVSHIPVQQDGSCNGLQHYAALGGDIDGARQVNLTPFDKPQDVYAEVAAIVSKLVEEDAAKGHDLAANLVGKINRKIVKPTVMTNVYGVTFVGAKAQVLTQLKEQLGEVENIDDMSTYLTTRVFSAMRSLFTNAHDIQDWLTQCARTICKTIRPEATKEEVASGESLSSVIWTSPIGLPVVQPYRKTAKRQVDTALQSVYLVDSFTLYGVLARKQAQAFPPNFVHSLDASHMLLTALNLNRDVSFASVHDSYWTHAADVPHMNTVLREQFVKLHSMDIVGNLKRELEDRYGSFYTKVELLTNNELGDKLDQFKFRKAAQHVLYDQLRNDLEYKEQLQKASTAKERKQVMDKPSLVQVLEQHRPLDQYLAKKTLSERVNGKMITQVVELEGAEKKKPFLSKFTVEDPPKKGDLDLNEVLVSPYFFS